jgi:transposase
VSVHRMEIITGTGRRRSWPTAIREQIVSETLAAETTVTEVARRHDVDRSLVYRWRRQFGVVGRARETGMFLPVEVSDGGAATRTPQDTKAEMAAAADSGLIEIVLGGGRRVRVGVGFDADALSRVLDVLDRR